MSAIARRPLGRVSRLRLCVRSLALVVADRRTAAALICGGFFASRRHLCDPPQQTREFSWSAVVPAVVTTTRGQDTLLEQHALRHKIHTTILDLVELQANSWRGRFRRCLRFLLNCETFPFSRCCQRGFREHDMRVCWWCLFYIGPMSLADWLSVLVVFAAAAWLTARSVQLHGRRRVVNINGGHHEDAVRVDVGGNAAR